MKKRVIALVLSVFMVLNPLTSYAAAPEKTEASETTEVAETTEVPETTEVAETTEVPETTAVMETAEVPETTAVTETTEVPETTAVTNTAAESVAVADRFLLNYQEISINMESGYPLPLYLTTGYYTEPSGTGKITWSSSDESIAAVDGEGRVTPVKPGEAIIKAVHKDYAGKTAQCKVTVYQSKECETFYYVSPQGSDNNPGTEAQPFQTIQAARDTIRGLDQLPDGGITVLLEDGKYYEQETIVFTPQDSGTQENPIVYKARNEGKAVITGEVPITGWGKAEDVEGMNLAAEGKLYVADVDQGWRFHDLYVNGERQQVSRSFNTDKWRDWPVFYGRAPLSYDPEKGARVVFGDGELDGLDGNEDVEVVLLPVMYWNTIPLVKHIDSSNNTAYLQSQIPSNFWPDHFGTGEGYYNIINTLKYLDQPGEWCIDSQAGKVYYWPKNEETINTDEIAAPKPYELLRLQGDGIDEDFKNMVEYLTFDGITFQYTDRLPENEFPEDWIIRNAENPDAAIYFDGTRNCRLINNEIRHSGSYGVTVNHYGQNNEILHNQMHDLGSGGVQLYGYGVGTVDVNYNNIVMYNSIYNMGVAPYQHAPGLGVFGSGTNTMAFNYIAGAPYAGISIVGTDENSISRTKPDTRAAYDMFGRQSSQYGIRFEDLNQLPQSELDGSNGEYFSIGNLAQKYQHSERNVAEYNILEDYSQSMDDGGALYSWYCGLGNVYAYNVLKEQLEGSRTWVFWQYMDDRAIGFTLQNNLCTGNFNATIDKSFAPYSNRRVDNVYAKFPQVPAGYDVQKEKVLDNVQDAMGGYKLAETKKPAILSPENGSENAKIPTTIVLNHCENASLYKIEIATDEAFKNIAETIETRLSVATTDKLEYDSSYYVRVTTREYLGTPQVSDAVSFKTAKQSAPDEVLRNAKLTNDIDAVLVQWTPVAKNRVNVYRKAEGEADYTLIGENVEGKGFLDSQIKEKTTYTYQIAGVNASGEGPRSEELKINTRELNMLFSDDFENETISDRWTDQSGKQTNLNPADAVVKDGKWEPSGSWREYYVGLNNKDWDDYAVEADITFKDLQPGAENYSAFGLITRASTEKGRKFYQFLIRSNGQKQMELQKADGNYWTQLAAVKMKENPVPGTLYRMRAESVGKSLRIYLNGSLFAEIEDESLTYGGIGFGYGKDYISVDNVRVSQPKQYKIHVDESMKGGTVTADQSQAAQGKPIFLTVKPDKGYTYEEGSLKVNGKQLTDTLFTMPGEDVTVTASFRLAAADGNRIYVSPEGSDDSGNGSFEAPYQSLAMAQEAVHNLVAKGLDSDVQVILRGGNYYLKDAVHIGPEDCDDTYRITYKNYEEEEVRVVGGSPVTGWTDKDGDGIYEADITGREGFYSLFANGERLPNAKEVKWQNVKVEDQSHMQAVLGGATSWFGEVLKVTSVNGSNLATDFPGGQFSGGVQYLQGAKEYINEPGEWAIAGSTLYYKPLDGTLPENSEIIAPSTDRIFYLQGTNESLVRNITIDGLQLEMNGFGENLLAHAGRKGDKTEEYESNLKGIVDLDNTSNVTVSNCILKNAGYMAVVMNHYSQENTISGNDIQNTGYAGIFMIGENPGSLNYINKNNTVTNNRIKDAGKFVSHGSGIYLMNSGDNTITHNNISEVPRYGISMKGVRYGVFSAIGVDVPFEDHWKYNQTMNNYIGYNTIFNTGIRSGDGGGIEGWGTGRDNWIDHNIIYNAYRGVATTGWRGHSIFTDDATHHTMVTNNVIYDENAVSVNAGTMMKSISNYVANNVFDIGYAYNGAANIGPYIEPSGGMAFKNNIVYSNTGGTLHNNGTWSEDGAGDRVLLKFDDGSYNVSGTAALDSLSVMDNNLYFNAKGKAEFEVLGSKLSLSDWKQSSKNKHKYDQNSIMEDPQFVDAQNRDYRLKADSPAMAIGISPIDTSGIGLLPEFRYGDKNDTPKTLFISAEDNGQASAAVNPGQTIQMSVSMRTEKGYSVENPEGTTFASSDESIASVGENGLVTAIAPGTAVITAEGKGLRDQYTIYVGEQGAELTADDVNLVLEKNDTAWIDVKAKTSAGHYVLPINISYESGNEEVVTVDDRGFLKAQAEGEAEIRIQASVNGENLTKDVKVSVQKTVIQTRDLYEKADAVTADTYGNGAVNQGTKAGMDKNGSYVAFKNVDFKEGAKRFTAVYETGNLSRVGSIDLRLDSSTGPLIGRVDCETTGAWGISGQSWIDVNPEQVKGIHDLYIVANPGALNLVNLQFSQKDAGSSVQSLELTGEDIVCAPQDGETEYTLTALTLDDLGYRTEEKAVTWELDGNAANISIDETTGVLTVGIPEEKETNLVIKAVLNSDHSIKAEKPVMVYDGTIVELKGAEADEKSSTAADGVSGVAFQGKDAYILYKNVDFKNGIEKYQVKYSYPNARNILKLHTGSAAGEVFSSVSLSSGSWANYVVTDQSISEGCPVGIQDLAITQSDWLNFHWIRMFMPNNRVPVQSYEITIDTNITNGKIESDKTEAEAGEEVNLTVEPNEGYILKEGSLKVNNGDVEVTDNRFVMPEQDVMVTAEFEQQPAQMHTVTIDPAMEHGRIEADKTEAAAGDTVTLTVTPEEGYLLTEGSLQVNGGEVEVTDNSFLMPEQDVMITAEFEQLSAETHTVTIDPSMEHGRIEADKTEAAEGETVTLSIIPQEGYMLTAGSLKVNDGAVEVANNSFVMPGQDVTITAEFEQTTEEMHTISIDPAMEHGKVEADKSEAAAGEMVALTIVLEEGYQLKEGSLKVNDGAVEVTDNSFLMPEQDVIITAEFEQLAAETFKVIIDPAMEHGNVAADKPEAAAGELITLTVVPNDGYFLKAGSLKVNNGNVKLTGSSFVMPEQNVNVTAEFEQKTVIITYKLAFDPRGGKVSPASITVTKEAAYGRLPVPSREGYSFKGWFTAASGGTQIREGEVCRLNANTTVYAQWSKLILKKPGKPTGLKASRHKSGSLQISWKKASNAKGYVVYRYNSTAKKWTKIKTTASTSYVDTGLKSASDYKYKVKAYSQLGKEKKYGSCSSVMTTATAPKKPHLLKVKKDGKGKVTINWSRRSGTDGYVIYMKTNKGDYKKIATKSSKVSSYTKSGLKKGRSYRFKVRGYNKAGSKRIYSSYSDSKKINF
ncbi:InlB B-repeat-containing protein [Robinsoniella peoriensis]|uniref:Endo-1,4-beta-xylanase A n=1 Tax=Robinsoniella peoriensis TaxID=180332 RepID=A0A4U8Q6W0_9FIRM|nr:Ig-like domain-containing protein [Robinsoniella peoriensis]TLD00054.1 Endo-1,4-beta-xylanase A precursor [Robinsoniella peoriensis]